MIQKDIIPMFLFVFFFLIKAKTTFFFFFSVPIGDREEQPTISNRGKYAAGGGYSWAAPRADPVYETSCFSIIKVHLIRA